MPNNESVGLKTNNQTNKIIQEAKDRLRSTQVDYDFYSTSFNYSAVEPESANHFFGNGKWKQSCKDILGAEVFDKHADKYGNKPVDFQMAAFVTEQARYFSQEEKITISDNNGIYTSSGKVLTTDKNRVIVMLPFTGTSTGKITNVSRTLGAKKALDRYSQVIRDIEPTIEKDIHEIAPEQKEEVKQVEQAVEIVKTNNKAVVENNDKTNTTLKVIALIIGIIIILAFINYQIKIKKQS